MTDSYTNLSYLFVLICLTIPGRIQLGLERQVDSRKDWNEFLKEASPTGL